MSVKDSSNTSRTDWVALEAMTDEEIGYSDIPPLANEFFENAILRVPAVQTRNLVQLDSEVIAMQDLIELEEQGWQALSSEGEASKKFYSSVLYDDAIMLFPGGACHFCEPISQLR